MSEELRKHLELDDEFPHLDIRCDHKGGKGYHCAECCPGNCKMHAAPQGCDHKFTFLRTAKWIESTGGYNTQFVRVDTFFCEKCLKQEEKRQEDYKRETPSWYRGD